jgi:proline racemase
LTNKPDAAERPKKYDTIFVDPRDPLRHGFEVA